MVLGVTAARWWPSPFGDDQLGMLNHIDDAKRRAALALVREGRLFDLGRVLDEAIPVFPGRYFRQTLVTTAHHATAAGSARTGSTGSPSWSPRRCSSAPTSTPSATCRWATAATTAGPSPTSPAGGVTRLGIETVPQIVTRGWLVDVAVRRVPRPGDVIEPDDVGDIDPEPGDAVLFHTGWGAHWDDPDPYLSGEPGPGLELAEWLADRGVALTGCDTWSYGPVPAEDPDRPFEVPQHLNVRHGVFIVENLDRGARRRRRAASSR